MVETVDRFLNSLLDGGNEHCAKNSIDINSNQHESSEIFNPVEIASLEGVVSSKSNTSTSSTSNESSSISSTMVVNDSNTIKSSSSNASSSSNGNEYAAGD